MSSNLMIVTGIIFLLVGIIYTGISFFINTKVNQFQKKNESNTTNQNNSSTKIGSLVFGIIGLLTSTVGILELVFHSSISKKVFQIFAIVYLLLVTICIIVFAATIKITSAKK